MSLRKATSNQESAWDWYKSTAVGETQQKNRAALATTWEVTETGAAAYVSKLYVEQFTSSQAIVPHPTTLVAQNPDFSGAAQDFTKVKHFEVQFVSGTGTLKISYGGAIGTALFNGTGVEEKVAPGSSIRHSVPSAAGIAPAADNAITITITGTVTYNVIMLGS